MLTFDDSLTGLQNIVRSSDIASALFSVTLMIFGHYLLINLFIAIIVQAFATDPVAVQRFREIILRRNQEINKRLVKISPIVSQSTSTDHSVIETRQNIHHLAPCAEESLVSVTALNYSDHVIPKLASDVLASYPASKPREMVPVQALISYDEQIASEVANRTRTRRWHHRLDHYVRLVRWNCIHCMRNARFINFFIFVIRIK